MNSDIIMQQADDGEIFFQTNTRAHFYARSPVRKCVNIETTARVRFYPQIGILDMWAEGVHIQIPLTDIADLYGAATETLRGFGNKTE